MKLKLITPPATLPVDLEAVKQFIRVVGDEDNAQIELMIKTALSRAEDITNLTLQGVSRYELELDGFENISFPKSPLIEVEKVEYLKDGALVELESSKYVAENRVVPGTLEFLQTPSSTKVIVTFTAGYEQLPSAIESWLNVEVSTLYEHREQIVVGASVEKNNYVDRLLDSFRIIPT